MEDLRDRVAVVTGAGSGIGRGIARALAKAGARVVVTDVEEGAAAATAAAIREAGGSASSHRVDVAEAGAFERLRDAVLREHRAVHVVCNNAGIYTGGPLLDMAESDWDWSLSVNLRGVVRGSQTFAPLLVQQGEGHIVNTASVGGFLSGGGMGIYCTTKFAVVGFSEALRDELAPSGVGLSILCPGPIKTRLAESDRLRPAEHAGGKATSAPLFGMIAEGMEPDEVGEIVRRGIERAEPYIFTHDVFRGLFEERFARVLAGFDALARE
ncbi:MAG: SDR family NAD(P)-dependent oxidoreductase [Myxococcota bacterium]